MSLLSIACLVFFWFKGHCKRFSLSTPHVYLQSLPPSLTHTHTHTHIRHCSYHSHSGLLQEVILAVGYFSVLQPDNQV